MTRNRQGIQLLRLKKPTGIGMESWRKIKNLLNKHAPGYQGVLLISNCSKLSSKKKGSLHGNTVQSYG